MLKRTLSEIRDEITMALGDEPKDWTQRYQSEAERAASVGEDDTLAELLGRFGELKLGTKLDPSLVKSVREAAFAQVVPILARRDIGPERKSAAAVLSKLDGPNALENLPLAAEHYARLLLKRATEHPGHGQ